MEPRILYITPLFSQLNTPYPATTYLKGFTDKHAIYSNQADLSIEVLLQIFSQGGLTKIFNIAYENNINIVKSSRTYLLKDYYVDTIEPVIQFLQGKNDMMAHRICNESYLPKGVRFNQSEDLDWNFGNLGIRDKARHLCTLYLEDLSDFIISYVDKHFGFSRYAEKISSCATHFDSIFEEIHKKNSHIIDIQNNILDKHIQNTKPNVLCITVPFPGNLLAALKCGEYIKKIHPDIKIIMGGGYPNTELRNLSDPRIFNFIDFLTLDDGEAPLLNIIEFLQQKRSKENLKRTFLCEENNVIYYNNSSTKDFSYNDWLIPSYEGINRDNYISVIELTNPMHRLWSDGFWIKLTMAHGCYWGKCSFCDGTLDYINRFEPVTASILCDKVENLMTQTGMNSFHFVDEAAPPALMIAFAIEVIKRKLQISWWTNIRFEKKFTEDVCILLKESGCIAVSGGLEVASKRVLNLINKGVTLPNIAKVCNNFTQAGILTHAYLMYGFPSETEQETIDSLEIVRQLFENQILTSGFWHQFALTTHSPIGQNPLHYNIKITSPPVNPFANNDLEYEEKGHFEHAKFSEGLKKSLYNYMQETGLELPVNTWFDFKTPKTKIATDYIFNCINDQNFSLKPEQKFLWINKIPVSSLYYNKRKKLKMMEIHLHTKDNFVTLKTNEDIGNWILHILNITSIHNSEVLNLNQIEKDYASYKLGNFEDFMQTHNFHTLKENGWLII